MTVPFTYVRWPELCGPMTLASMKLLIFGAFRRILETISSFTTGDYRATNTTVRLNGLTKSTNHSDPKGRTASASVCSQNWSDE